MNDEHDRTPAIACFGLIHDPAGRIVMVRQASGHRLWALPGGFAQDGEDLEQTVIREVREETQLDVTVNGVIAVADRDNLLVFVFRAHSDSQHAIPQEDEVEECRWLSPEEILELGSSVFALAATVAQLPTGTSAHGLQTTVLHTPGGGAGPTYLAGPPPVSILAGRS